MTDDPKEHGFKKHYEIEGPEVSIKKDGTITLLTSIVEESDIYPSSPPPNVVLYSAEEEEKMAIEPKETVVEGGISLRRVNPDADTFSISAKSFLDANNISHGVTQHYPAEWKEEEGMIVVDLDV